MTLFKRRQKPGQSPPAIAVQTRPACRHPFLAVDQYIPLSTPETKLYRAMREAIPVIDAALYKIQRLIGGFRLTCDNPRAERDLNQFARQVRVGSSMTGLEHFICSYLDSLLLCGNAVGEIVLSADRQRIAGLYNASFSDVLIREGDDPMQVEVCRAELGKPQPVEFPQLILYTALHPEAGSVTGTSILRSLPFVSSILLKIYHAVGQNFDRVGNIRFAVTYKPSSDGLDRAYAKERAQQIAREWADGMAASRAGDIRDFVAVGDVDIKVIGADNQMIDCEIPARQMLEQIVAKLSLPPFMLGLSWSTTERMSQQQADVLANELGYYRRLLNPVIQKIATAYLRMEGYSDIPSVEWDTLNFQDAIYAAQSRLYNAQAEKIELENGTKPEEIPVDVSTEPTDPTSKRRKLWNN